MGISVRHFQQMKERLGRPTRLALPAFDPSPRQRPGAAQIILGIDPSLRSTGYGVIRSARQQPSPLAHGTIAFSRVWERSRCLAGILAQLREVIHEHRPTVCVVEGLFYAQNLRTALTMGEARGAAIAAAAEAGLEVYEIAPRKVKLAIVGYGAAQKLAVAKMVQRMLHLAELPGADAADALALALALARETTGFSLNPLKRV